MSTSLVIVESPAKAKTISRYLGRGFKVMASYGHVRDLLSKNGAVDTENNFTMHYQPIEKSAKAVNEIIRSLKQADALYLATDPDREGEAIAWHLCELLKEKGSLDDKNSHRVIFHEVTQRAVKNALDNPRQLSMDLVNAQQARCAVDYLVGFNISPLLWKKIQRGLSAGRVQSPALKMIVEREEEIERFEVREYWTVEAQLEQEKNKFTGRLTHLKNKKLKQFDIVTCEAAANIREELLAAANGVLRVSKVEKKQRRRQPAPPFITSTLQQEAVRKLGLTAQRAMRAAQQLYEGVNLGGEGVVGLITYMRTDSVSLAQEAQRDIRDFIAERYGADQMPPQPRVFKTKTKNAQEAHEAIRPTSIRRAPDKIKSFLSAEQWKLYQLIWKRALASQMNHATIDTVAVDMNCGEDNIFRANGSSISSPGFMVVYQEGRDDKGKENEEKLLPPLKEGAEVALSDILPHQHFTEPPPRYTEASLVKNLEEHGIGRPSTYASILSTLKQRGYVDFDKKQFVPTDIGRTVNHFLDRHFGAYVDYEFTARLEDELDAISRGEKDWLLLMKNFWPPLAKQIKEKEENVTRSEAIQARELGADPATGAPVSVRIGRYGPYAQIGSKDDDEKPRFAGLRPDQKLNTITLEEALKLFKLPRELGHSKEGEEIVVGSGRFGFYIRYGNKFVSLKEDDPYTIELERALELVAAKKTEEANREIQVFKDAGLSVLNGRYGPYISDGNRNFKIPKDRDAAALTLEDCQKIIAEAPPQRGRRGKTVNAAKKTSAPPAGKKKRAVSKKRKTSARARKKTS